MRIPAVIAGTVALALWTTAAATAPSAAKLEVGDPEVTIAGAIRSASTGGASALDHIRNARAAIAVEDAATAREELTAAQFQLKELRALNPSASLQDSIRAVQHRLEVEGAAAAQSDLQPIAQSVDVVDDYAEAVARVTVLAEEQGHVGGSVVVQHIERALGHLAVEDVAQASEELQSAYEASVYTEVDLPVAAAYSGVTTALDALDAGHPRLAETQLAAAKASAETLVRVSTPRTVDIDVAAEPD